MATKYHIGRSGAPTTCIAQPGNCPLGGMDEHTYSIEDITTMADGFNSSLVEYEKTGKIGKLPEDVTKSYVIGVRRALRMGLEDEEQKQTNPKSLNKLQQLESKSNQIIEAIDNQDDKAKSKHIKEFNDTVDTMPERPKEKSKPKKERKPNAEEVRANNTILKSINNSSDFVSDDIVKMREMSDKQFDKFYKDWKQAKEVLSEGSDRFVDHLTSVLPKSSRNGYKTREEIIFLEDTDADKNIKTAALRGLVSFGQDDVYYENQDLIEEKVIDKSAIVNKDKINALSIGKAIHLNDEEFINNISYADVHKMDRNFEDYSPRQQRRIKAKLRDLKENIEFAKSQYKKSITKDSDIKYFSQSEDKYLKDCYDFHFDPLAV